MQKYTTLQRTKIVQFYFENGRSITQTQLAYKRYFQVRKAPIYRTIMKIIERFQEQGAVRDLPRPGRQRSVVTEANRQRVSDNIESSPGTPEIATSHGPHAHLNYPPQTSSCGHI
uniref:DUF4817 domain-containing protein n=1 Tax=Cacopsylla melanoneura TaxID=428564 RepID=A0A8D8M9H9_9HEMI